MKRGFSRLVQGARRRLPIAEEKVFVLGVGAQKSGTTFLAKYLAAQPRADFGVRKEYHVLDALFLPLFGEFRDEAIDQVRHDLATDEPKLGPPRQILPFHMIATPQLYFAYFNDLLSTNHVRLTGDITPSYSALSVENLSWVRDEFARRGISVRPVFLMRDPVYRLQSMVRMKFRNNGASPGPDEELAAVMAAHCSDLDLARGGYHVTLQRLFEVFGREGVFVKLYEDFFTPAIAGELGRFLRMELTPPRLEQKFNVSATPNHLSREDYDILREGYLDVIEGVKALTGLAVEDRWRWKPAPET